MKTRASRLTAGILASAALVLGIPVPAAAQSGALCGFEGHVSISPGITNNMSYGTFGTSGGRIGCLGAIAGAPITGFGSIEFRGEYGPYDTCLEGEGSGTFSLSLPTARGTATLTGPFTLRRNVALAEAHGAAGSVSLDLEFLFLPDPGGDCVLTPITGATVTGEGTITG